MADKKEITDIILYDGPVAELNEYLERIGDKRRYEIAGLKFYGHWQYHPESDSAAVAELSAAGYDGLVNQRLICWGAGTKYPYQIHGTPIRLVKNNAIPVIDPIIGS